MHLHSPRSKASIVMERECQQNDSLANGYRGLTLSDVSS